MFSEILKIIPKLDAKALDAMQRALSSRFTKIAKGFGKGVMNALKFAGGAGLALGLIDKVLNPLKEIQEAIDKTLKTSDDLATNANQFNTTTGKLAKLSTLAGATGLDQDNLFTLITKFQTAVAQAQANPNDDSVSSVRNFVGQKDSAEAFFNFIQQLQKMEKNQQLLIQEQVFGEKQILKMADFLQSDFGALAKATGIDKVSTGYATRQINKNAANNDLADSLGAGRNFKDMLDKGDVINEGMIRERDKSERIALERENARIKSYSDLQQISQTADQIMGLVDKGVAMLGSLITSLTPMVNKIIPAIDKFMSSPMVKGILKFTKGE